MAEVTSKSPAPAPAPSGGDLVANLADSRRKLKEERNRLRSENEQLKKAVTDLTNQNADLKTKADNSATLKRVQELEGQIREHAHRRIFDGLAKKQGVAEDSLDLLWQVAGWKAEADEVDEAAMTAVIAEQKGKPGVSRLFGASSNGPPPPLVKPGPASGKGSESGTNGTQPLAFDDPRWSDVKYMMQNFDKVSAGSQERIERGEV